VNDRDGIGRALSRIPSGLFVLTAGRGQEATGILASFVQQVGFEPPALCVAVKKGRSLEDLIRRERAFCLAVLDAAGKKLMSHFARGFDPGEAAFTGIDLRTSALGIPYPAEAQAFLACRVIGEAADWSDHTVFCGEVVGGEGRIDQLPLVHVRKNGFQY
jgi:flavin reductase (DIM6/NTAB) family NADH-FMN oxidoreductase RutF